MYKDFALGYKKDITSKEKQDIENNKKNCGNFEQRTIKKKKLRLLAR